MTRNQKETLHVRIISVGFVCLAFAVFKPLGIGELGMMLYVHLLAIWLLGVGVCYVTEFMMKYIVGIPASLEKGVDYIIWRNLWFQLINSPLEALLMCVYLHFPMTAVGASDTLSWKAFVQTLLLMTFSSFAIGLYWRYKFRSRYLTMELEETKALNQQLKDMQRKTEQRVRDADAVREKGRLSSDVVLTGTTNESVTLQIPHLLYIETVGNYAKVFHLQDDTVRSHMIRATSKQIEDELSGYPIIVRCHRAFLVNLGQVEQVVSKAGSMQLMIRHCSSTIPVSRRNVAIIKEAILKSS